MHQRLPERHANWNTVWRRFARWPDAGLFELLFEAFARCGAADERVQILDGTVVRAHQHAAGGVRGCEAEALGRSRGGFATKIHLRCDGRGLPLAVVLQRGQRHEARAFGDLVEGLARSTRCVIGDMGYDADAIREALLLRGILPVIPPNPVRREHVALDRDLYRLRNRVKRLVNRLKQLRSVATHYDKTALSFLSFVHIAAVCVRLRSVHAATSKSRVLLLVSTRCGPEASSFSTRRSMRRTSPPCGAVCRRAMLGRRCGE